MDMPTSFGAWLKLRRKILDLTQDGLARAVGCSVVTIRKLESDERRPSRQIAERLAECLRIAIHERAAFIRLARAEPSTSVQLPEIVPQRPRSNLPIPLTRLIGRKAEVVAVRSALLRGDTRLLTLVGPPGVGKTRLALQAASELRDAFADGVCFVALAAIRDRTLVSGAIAQALGLRESGGQPLHVRLHEYLQDKRVLLVLDNFEQVVAAAPVVIELLEANAGLNALITSRTALRVRGEHVLPVAPLPLPNHKNALSIQALAQNAAVALFIERAHATQPSFALTEANALAVAELCTHLDGLPLAIELVAARVKLLPPAALLSRLDQRLALLTDGPRDLPERHQTLRAALAGSYELLSSDAQALLRQLGVFVGGWTLEASETLCLGTMARVVGPVGKQRSHASQSIIPLLTELVEHSLVTQRPSADSMPRFTMLETIREYAREQLAACDEIEATQRAHAAYFLDLAERADHELHGPHQVVWLDLLELEHPNLRAALEWMIAALGWEQALRLGAALAWFWYVRGYSSEGRRWLDRILTGWEDLPDGSLHIAAGLYAAGHLALFQGDFGQAREHLQASAVIWRTLDAQKALDQRGEQRFVITLTFLFLTTQFQGDKDTSELILDEYLAVSDRLDDPRSRAMALFNVGRRALQQQGDHQAARASLEQSLALLRPLGDLWYITQVLADLGLIAVYQEDYAAATTWYTEGLALAHTLKDRTLIASALNNLGDVARCEDDYALAGRQYAESLQLHQELGNQSETPRLLHNLGYVALHNEDSTAAHAYFRESLHRFQLLGMTRGIAEALAGFAALAAVARQSDEAARLWGAAEALHEAEGTPVWPVDRREQIRYQSIASAQSDTATWGAAWQAGRANAQMLGAILSVKNTYIDLFAI